MQALVREKHKSVPKRVYDRAQIELQLTVSFASEPQPPCQVQKTVLVPLNNSPPCPMTKLLSLGAHHSPSPKLCRARTCVAQQRRALVKLKFDITSNPAPTENLLCVRAPPSMSGAKDRAGAAEYFKTRLKAKPLQETTYYSLSPTYRHATPCVTATHCCKSCCFNVHIRTRTPGAPSTL
jgi:hypothetical protein